MALLAQADSQKILAESKAQWLRKRMEKRGELPKRPGAFPTFAAFLGDVKGNVPEAIVLKIDAAPADKLQDVLKEIYPGASEGMRDLMATWVQFLPSDLVSKMEVSEWDHAVNAKLTVLQKEVFANRRGRVEAEAYTKANDPLGLFALFRAAPARDSTGHLSFVKITLGNAFLEMVTRQRLDTPN